MGSRLAQAGAIILILIGIYVIFLLQDQRSDNTPVVTDTPAPTVAPE